MVLCNVEFVNKVSQYLDVKLEKTRMKDKLIVETTVKTCNQSIEGFATIIYFLTKNSKYSHLLGNDEETKALIQQWLEYMVVCLNFAETQGNTKRVLKELNSVLKDKTYINGTKKTIADVALYYLLHSIMAELNYKDKAEFIHVSRWFDYMQQEDKLRQELSLINFNLLHLYL